MSFFVLKYIFSLSFLFYIKSVICSMLGLWSAVSVCISVLQTPDLQTTDWVLVCLSVQYRGTHFKPKKISMRSKKLCLTIPKKLHDNKLSIISTHSNCVATFLGLFLRSQKLCLTINCLSSLLQTIVRQNFGISSEIPKSIPDRLWVELWAVNCQAYFLGSQKWCLTIVRQHFWDFQASFLGSHAYF